MGLPWLRLFVDTPDHTKVARLALELGRDADAALGIVVRLWAWVARVAPSGAILSGGRPQDVRRTSADASDVSSAASLIEYGCRWSGPAGVLAAALEAAGLIDRVEGGFEVHDWEEYAGAQVAKAKRDHDRRTKDRERKAAKRAAEKAARAAAAPSGSPTDVQRKSDGRPAEVRALERDGDGEGEEDQKHLSAAAPDGEPPEEQHAPTGSAAPAAEPAEDLGAKVREVFEYWRKTMHKTLPTKLGDKRRTVIEARLREGYTVEHLRLAIDGCSATPHNMGLNNNGVRYDDIELICRDQPHVDRFMATAKKAKCEAAPAAAQEEQTVACSVCGARVGAVGRMHVGAAVLCVACAVKLEHAKGRPSQWERRERDDFDASWVEANRRPAA